VRCVFLTAEVLSTMATTVAEFGDRKRRQFVAEFGDSRPKRRLSPISVIAYVWTLLPILENRAVHVKFLMKVNVHDLCYRTKISRLLHSHKAW